MTKSPVELGVTGEDTRGYAEVTDGLEPAPFAEACDVDLGCEAGGIGTDGGAWSLIDGFVGECRKVCDGLEGRFGRGGSGGVGLSLRDKLDVDLLGTKALRELEAEVDGG